jgi:hypothetical protein
MNKMQFDKLIINNNPQNTENIDTNINKKEEIRINSNKDKVDIPPEKDTSPKVISPLPDNEANNKDNESGFDDKLLQSQAFAPEKLALEIPNPGDFNFGEDIVNPYEDESNTKKNDVNRISIFLLFNGFKEK